MKKIFAIILAVCILSVNVGSMTAGVTYNTLLNPDGKLGIVRSPSAQYYSGYIDNMLPSFSVPSYNPDSANSMQVDVRSCDLTKLDLTGILYDLMHSNFDSATKWPDKLPTDFNYQKVMEAGKNPGLNVRSLHEKGITGKGVGIAIIGDTLLVDHTEYKDRIKMYEEIHIPDGVCSSMSGPAAASVVAGKSVGVAPGADLYYIAEQPYEYKNGIIDYDFKWLAKSIDRIIEVNRTLAVDKKIRVISITAGWFGMKGAEEVNAAVERAKKEGIFVVGANLSMTYNFNYFGLGRDYMSDPDKLSSYSAGIWWRETLPNFEAKGFFKRDATLMVPVDSRCTASCIGVNDYTMNLAGDRSMSVLYLAGLYALTCQVDNDITPQEFLKIAVNTGDTLNIKYDGKDYALKKVVNPVKLIDSLSKAE